MKKEIIKTALIVVLTIICTAILFFKCDREKEKKDNPIVQVVQTYEKNTTHYNQINDSLTKKLAEATQQLNKTKNSLFKAQNKLIQTLNRKSEAITPEAQLSICDSIIDQTTNYILVCNSVVHRSDSVILVQSFIIGEKDKQIQMCDTSFQKAVSINLDLQKELKKTKRKQKFQKTLNKVLSIGLLITTSILAIQQIK